MPRYLSLINFTDHGIRDIRDSMHRAEGFRKSVENAGGSILNLYWAIGQYDGAVLFEAPSETIATALLLNLAHNGFVRTQTLQIFDEKEFQTVLSTIASSQRP
jgi:uncharacterized protein with GYD domain